MMSFPMTLYFTNPVLKVMVLFKGEYLKNGAKLLWETVGKLSSGRLPVFTT